MNSKKKVFITGASSELMLKVISIINKEEYQIFTLSRKKSDINEDGIQNIEGNIQNIQLFKKHLESCDILIHAAAITHSFNSKKYYDINLNATKELVDIAVELKVKKFIFISSRAAGLESGAYGKSKFLAEEYIKQKISNRLILRPSEIYGGNKKEGIQKLFSDINTKQFIICPLNVPKLYPIYIDDAAQFIYNYTFIENPENKIITINGNKGYTYNELIKLISDIFHKKRIIIPIPKFIFMSMKIILKIFQINIGIVPDQIDRLYSKKEINITNKKTVDIKKYLKEIYSK